MGGNSFYSNAEAYALEILQQKLMKEAQRSAQQTWMELSALKSFLGQGQLIYCIPFGGVGLSQVPHPPFPFSLPNNGMVAGAPTPLMSSSPGAIQQPPALPAPPSPSSPPSSSSPSHRHHQNQSILHVNVKNTNGKAQPNKPGSDQCNLGKDGIEVTIDLREYLPAEIYLDVEEKMVEVKANHVDGHGSKTFARRYDLPACIVLDSVKCILTHDGFLMFSAAWCKME